MRAVCAPKCLEKDAHADFLCLHCYPNAVGDNTWAYFFGSLGHIVHDDCVIFDDSHAGHAGSLGMVLGLSFTHTITADIW